VQAVKVRVIPRAKKARVEKFGDGFKVYLTAPPVDGKANKALLEALAAHLNVRKSQVSIIKGERSRDKIVEVI